jgi:hypothetical protein
VSADSAAHRNGQNVSFVYEELREAILVVTSRRGA